MNLERRNKIQGRVVDVASAALSAQGYVSPIDVLLGTRWLDVATLERWMELFHVWATEQNLDAIEITYVAQVPVRATLSFTDTNNPVIERFFRMHRVSREHSELTNVELTNVATAT